MQLSLNAIQKDELIRLYAGNTVSAMDTRPDLIMMVFAGTPEINSIADVERSCPEYKEFMDQLRTIKKGIEMVMEKDSAQAQARYCLIQLASLVAIDDAVRIDIFNKIVEHLFLSVRWAPSVGLVDNYRQIAMTIQVWNHFFVSYTTRDTPAVNNLYDPELFKQFKPDIVQKEIVSNNLIAKFIVKCLKKYNGLKVFFDRESIICGDIIKDEVFEYCQKTFAFIQLIEDISFNRENGVVNWCYEEWREFNSHNGDKKSEHFFIVEGFDINLATVPSEFRQWAADILQRNFERIRRPFDVISVKKKCQDFAATIVNKRECYINSLIKTVI